VYLTDFSEENDGFKVLHCVLYSVDWTFFPETADCFSEQEKVTAFRQSREDPKIHQKCGSRI